MTRLLRILLLAPLRILLLASLLLASNAAAHDWGLGSARGWSTGGRPHGTGHTSPGGATAASRRLQAYSEQRRFEARVRMTHAARDSERRSAEQRLRMRGTPAALASYRRRVARQDDLDHLRLASGLIHAQTNGERANAHLWWASLGPNTRRVFQRSGLALRSLQRDADRRARLDRLGQDIEGRQPTPADELFAAPGQP